MSIKNYWKKYQIIKKDAKPFESGYRLAAHIRYCKMFYNRIVYL